ncbi:MAG: hypothetical protein IT311_13595 [Anaerolineales bacterium]|nr:hypothetical protein [Anaerolineales bacterium]
MNTKSIYILYYGLLIGFFAEFLFPLFISLSRGIALNGLNWSHYALTAIVFLAIKFLISQTRDTVKLKKIEEALLALNIIFALAILIASFILIRKLDSEPYLVIFIAFGSPSIFALILWKLRTR